MICPTSTKDITNITLDDILEFMKEKTPDEIDSFKEFANTEIEGTNRKPAFFEIRNWVLRKYFPEIYEPKPKMIDKIMAL
jgi:hypothetical protein